MLTPAIRAISIFSYAQANFCPSKTGNDISNAAPNQQSSAKLKSTLTLLMAPFFADHPDNAIASYDFAVSADFFD
jgi:hypothetical protein